MTVDNCTLSERYFSEGPVLMLSWKQDDLKLTNNTLQNELLQLKL